MAELACDSGASLLTVTLTAASAVRGVRVTTNSSGLVAVQDATARGDFVLAQDGAASAVIAAFDAQEGIVPALASEACAVGDLAYAAASGKFSKTSTNAALMGRWVQAASGDAVLGSVKLFGVA